MIRYVTLYGGKMQERLKIETVSGRLELTRQVFSDGDSAWCDRAIPLAIPAKSSSELADVTAALTTMWDEIRAEEMAERASKAR